MAMLQFGFHWLSVVAHFSSIVFVDLRKQKFQKKLFAQQEMGTQILSFDYRKKFDKIVQLSVCKQCTEDAKPYNLTIKITQTCAYVAPCAYIIAHVRNRCTIEDMLRHELLKT
uniref:Uncharacterized protein n=1 Tax=Glossina austeni TaxID=7395 RepID=A0A1A9VL12_GLOAU